MKKIILIIALLINIGLLHAGTINFPCIGDNNSSFGQNFPSANVSRTFTLTVSSGLCASHNIRYTILRRVGISWVPVGSFSKGVLPGTSAYTFTIPANNQFMVLGNLVGEPNYNPTINGTCKWLGYQCATLITP
jgi:hypothetical protein